MSRDNGSPEHYPPPRKEPASASEQAALLARAIGLHRQGQTDAAEPLYLDVLREAPRNADALHLLGIIKAQRHDNAAAAELIGQALAVDPGNAAAHANLAKVFIALKRLDDALAHYDQALTLGRDNAEAHNDRGNVLAMLDRPEEALAGYDRALAIKPDYAHAHYNRGNVLQSLERQEEALAAYDRALAIEPDHAEALNNRSTVLVALKRHEEALVGIDRALTLALRDAQLHYNRGNVLREIDRPKDALAAYDRALKIAPDHLESLINRGNALRDLDRPEEALASYDRALAIAPQSAEAFNNRGNALRSIDRLDDALTSFDKALSLKPDYLDAQNNRATVLRDLGRVEEAGQAYRRILEQAPNYELALGNLLETKLHVGDWRDYASLAERIRTAVRTGTCPIRPFMFLAISGCAAEQRQCAQSYHQQQYPRRLPSAWTGRCHTQEKIRIAYLSADLREHAVSYLLAGVLERHDRSRFDTVAISFKARADSGTGARIANAFDRFIDVSGQNDSQVAALVRDLEIDIAVDLMGYTGGSRTGILARRPAPLQVSYLGYSGTMGAPFIDYIVADRIVIPSDRAANYSEAVVHLPNSYMPTDSARTIAPLMPTRDDAKLPQDGFVFCSFNNFYKFNPRMFDVWMRLLKNVDRSVLWLPTPNAETTRNLLKEAESRGVASHRIVFAARTGTNADHLARLQLADLSLDTFPYGGHTTTCDALWAGVPVLTCTGEAFAARVAASLLNAVGLPELITADLGEYEALALKLATDCVMLRELRAKLARNRTAMPLFDTDRYRRHLERAYITMWERHQRGEAPAGFSVGDD